MKRNVLLGVCMVVSGVHTAFGFELYSTKNSIKAKPFLSLVGEKNDVQLTTKEVLDSLNLSEVVVTGVGNAIQRRRLSTNITKVSAKDLERMPSSRLDELLQGALPNVQINLSGSQPGSTSMIRARGLSSAFTNSTPIVYVDGVRVDNINTGSSLGFSKNGYGSDPYSTSDMPMGEAAASGSLSDIPLENIEHIEYVTGGAATTLYGSDAANGVIQIFTKKGGKGPFRASFTTELGLNIANSQYYHFKRTKELLHQVGLQQLYRLNFHGGTEKFGYSFGASMSRNTGTLIHNGNDNKKYDLRFGSQLKINKMLEYQNSFGFLFQDYHRRRNGNQGFYTGLWFAEGAAANNFTYILPDGSKYNFNADIDAASDDEYRLMQSFVDRAEKLQNNQERVKRFQTAQTLLFNPLKNLNFKAVLGVDYRSTHSKEIITNEYLVHTQVKPEGTSDAGRINNFRRDFLGITIDMNGQHKYYYEELLSNIATAGFQYFNTRDEQAVYNGRDVRDGAMVMSGAGKVQADEWMNYLHNYGFYFQNNFGLKNRYYLDLGMRVDYNTAFGDNVGWQFYPKVGLSYMLTEEPFMQSLKDRGIIPMARLFANYGVAGSYPPAFEYQRTIAMTPFQSQQAAIFGKYGNPNLGPEKKHSYEIGFNASFLNDKITLGMTYYYTRTKGALFNVPTLPSSGQTSTYLANIGEISNSGLEWSLDLNLLRTRDWSLAYHLSLNTNSNRVISTGGTQPFSIGGFNPSTIQNMVEEGKTVGYLRGNKAVLNADGTFKEVLPLQDLGRTTPTMYGNMSLDVNYKAWQLYVLADYQTGSYVHSFDAQFRLLKGLTSEYVPAKALEGLNQKKEWLSFTNYFVEKADFLKVRTIALSYAFRPRWKASFIQNIHLGVNINNPFSFTASRVDPEAVLPGAKSQGAVAVGGLNYSTFSAPRQYIFSVKFDF